LKTIVILIHGIRTHAEWQEKIPEWLDLGPETIVKPIGYGRFDLLKFLSPLRTRQKPIDILTREIDDLIARHPSHAYRRVVIAHSFGTYAISKILEARPSIELDDLLLCGSIVPADYNWIQISKQVKGTILNDCGRRDIWPVIARSVTWGYGATGTYGFNAGAVTNRFHSIGHSEFFSKNFVREFWRPFVQDSTIAPSHVGSGIVRSPWYFSLFEPKLRWLFLFSFILFILPLKQEEQIRDRFYRAYIAAYENLIGPYVSEASARLMAQADYLYFLEDNREGAFELYEKAAAEEGGNPAAQASMAKMVFMGWGGQMANPDEATRLVGEVLEDLTTLAKTDATAAYNLAFLYGKGIGVEPSPQSERDLNEFAANEGHGGALFNTGANFGRNEDYESALEKYRESAKTGNVFGNYEAGRYLRQGFAGEPDYPAAISYLERARAKGHVAATYNLALIYRDESWDGYDLETSIERFRDAADLGSAYAQTELGIMLLQALDGQGQSDEAVAYLRLATDQGYARAFRILGKVYMGDYSPAYRDVETAVDAFRDGSNLGNELSSEELSRLYFGVDEVAADYSLALEYSLLCAEVNGRCANRAGRIYQDGLGVDKDALEAISLFQRAIDLGNPSGAHNLMNLNHDLAMTETNQDVAFEHGQAAIAAGYTTIEMGTQDPLTYSVLADIHVSGLPGVPLNQNEATRLYLKAAELGGTSAQNNIGIGLLLGLGTEPLNMTFDERMAEARRWLLSGARSGSLFALANIEGLKDRTDEALEYFLASNNQGAVLDNDQKEMLLGLFDDIDTEQIRAESLRGAEEIAMTSSCRANLLGLRYYEETRLPSNISRAAARAKSQELFQVAAEGGSPAAAFNLGRMHILQEAVPANRQTGLDLLDQAISLGFSEAALFAAQVYNAGIYVPKNEAAVGSYLKQALELGEEGVVAALLTSVTKDEDIADLDIGPSICSPPNRSQLAASLDVVLP
jgi:TPR repeat protein